MKRLRHEVRLRGRQVGHLEQVGETVEVVLDEDYTEDPGRDVLGLAFEDEPHRRRRSTMRLPAWFSNLLPEGRLREWMAVDAGVNEQREVELLLHVGHDLPGAVTVHRDPAATAQPPLPGTAASAPAPARFRFSLAGVALKTSALREGDRFVVPAARAGGDWIVKLPDSSYPGVPVNEYACMAVAAAAGVVVPETVVVHRDEVEGLLPEAAWPRDEHVAYAVRRFDRDEERRPVHVEDLCQVLERPAEDKYRGSYEVLARLVYRQGQDEEGLRQVVRRLVVDLLVGNTDGHLKNWSLRYADPRHARLSPAYDVVCASAYRPPTEDVLLALHLDGQKRFAGVRVAALERLVRKAGAPHLVDDVRPLVEQIGDRVEQAWEDAFRADVVPARVRDEVAVRVSAGLAQLRGP